MTTSDSNLMLIFAASAVAAFVLTMIGADIGASQRSIITALCSIAVLGSMAATVFITSRRPQ